MLPAKHILDFCATAPNTSPPIRDISIGACMLPGPLSLLLSSVVASASTRMPAISTGSTYPFILFAAWARPRLNPFFNAMTPVPTPRINPISATQAFRSPADIRMIILSGHPRNTSEPMARIIPSTNRTMGDEPAIERYSFVAAEIMNAPSTRPMISGLAYCTVSVECIPRAPAVSLIKHAIQNAILAGLPK